MTAGGHVVDVVVEDARWSDLERLASIAVPAALGPLEGCEVVILGCDDARIAALNGDFRGKSQPTNVLSWPSKMRDPEMPPGDPELGDIAIAYETCAREAAEQGKAFDAHVVHLLVHAVLHLLGHDHEAEAEAIRMEDTERRIVTALGFPDPYADASMFRGGT
ncbi:MAG: rRNA maturation RNase YbeY [Pseudomonadota bacterium]